MRRILTIVLFISHLSATATANEQTNTPDDLAEFYCHSMHQGAFLSTKGINKILAVSSSEAEHLFDGYGAPDIAHLIESSTIVPRTVKSDRAIYDVSFAIKGMLAGTSVEEKKRTYIVDELVIEKNEHGRWEITHFTPSPMESVSSAIRGLNSMKDFYCPPDTTESGEPCSVDQAVERLWRLGANGSLYGTCAKSLYR